MRLPPGTAFYLRRPSTDPDPVIRAISRLEDALEMNMAKILAGRGVDQPQKLEGKIKAALADLYLYDPNKKGTTNE